VAGSVVDPAGVGAVGGERDCAGLVPDSRLNNFHII
jgi:hypothetical protein